LTLRRTFFNIEGGRFILLKIGGESMKTKHSMRIDLAAPVESGEIEAATE
jgi:hypothetical protein